MIIREIVPQDNKKLAETIRKVLVEYNADPETTVLGDPTLNRMFETYQMPRAAYFVAESEGLMLGGSGIKQLDGTDKNICELQRMYLLPQGRGKGIGQKLMDLCIVKAKEFGYEKMYIETLTQMPEAYKLYIKNGFKRIEKPLGNTGHGGCNVFMIRQL